MRLWHEALLPLLPRQQLLGQHRECCALRGNSWGKKHATVDYVFWHNPLCLFRYHQQVMAEMQRRGYKVEARWQDPLYRGRNCPPYPEEVLAAVIPYRQPVYAEHNYRYLIECINNLARKEIDPTVLQAMQRLLVD